MPLIPCPSAARSGSLSAAATMYVCNNLPTPYATVRAGLGIGMLPCFFGDSDSALCRVGHDAIPISRDLWLVYHRDMKASRRVEAMQDFISELVDTYIGAPCRRAACD